MRKKLSVFVAIPTMTNRITIQIAALLDALRQGSTEADSEFDLKFQIEMGKSPVEYARNVLCGAFLKTDCDKLWFIDEDMLPYASVVRLIHSEADIACARMYKFDHPNPDKKVDVGLGLCAMTKAPNGMYSPLMPEVGAPAVQRCDAVGTGCTVIARRVIEDRRLWSDNVYSTLDGKTIDGNVPTDDGDFAPAIFRHPRAPNGMGLVGEDIEFCERARSLGYTIEVDLNAVCGHFKSIDIDQAGFLAQKTVERVFAGLQLEDGRVLKADLKASLTPPVDKSIHTGEVMVK